MKQTAVEWLIEKVNSKEWQDKFIWHKQEDFKKAKEMEKEQIIDAFCEDNYEYKGYRKVYLSAELYYNETFKSE